MDIMFGGFVVRARDILAVLMERMYKRARNKRMSNFSSFLINNNWKYGTKQTVKQPKSCNWEQRDRTVIIVIIKCWVKSFCRVKICEGWDRIKRNSYLNWKKCFKYIFIFMRLWRQDEYTHRKKYVNIYFYSFRGSQTEFCWRNKVIQHTQMTKNKTVGEDV